MWQPDVTVAAICEKDGRFLVVEERSKSTQRVVLNQPAGHLDPGETLLEAVIRETKEETCRHFTPQALVGLYQLEISETKTYIRYSFCGSVSEIDSRLTLDTDIIDTHWLTLNELRASKNLRSNLVVSCIEDYLSGERHPLSILKESR